MQTELNVEEELQYQRIEIGDIVKFSDIRLPMFEGLIGIVTEFFNEENDVLVLLTDGKLMLDRVEAFVVL